MNAQPLHDALASHLQRTSVPLVCAYLFGSYARGEQTKNSDVDVAVLLPTDASTGLTGPISTLRGELERLTEQQVDLVDLRRAPVDLVHRVLRDGKLLVERDSGERVRFEVRARNEYFDLLPHLRRYRQERAA